MISQKENTWYFRTPAGDVFGPAEESVFVSWAREGRLTADGSVSRDRVRWIPAAEVPQFAFDWLVLKRDGRKFGPFHRDFLDWLRREGSVSSTDAVFRRCTDGGVSEPQVRTVEKVVEKVVEKTVEKPVVKVVEKIVYLERPAEPAAPVAPEVVAAPYDRSRALATRPKNAGWLAAGTPRERMAALEAALRDELMRARQLKNGRFGGR